MPPTDALAQSVSWMGMRWQLPGDWDLLAHALSPQRGSLHFADRRRHRLQWSWSKLEGKPDLDHLLRDYQLQALEEDPDACFERLTAPGPWHGVARLQKDRITLIRAACYLAGAQRLLEATIQCDDLPGDRRALATSLLASFAQVEDPQHARRWRIMDLDVQVPQGWHLTELETAVADVRMTFHERPIPGRADPAIMVRRRGMADIAAGSKLDRMIMAELPDVSFSFMARSYRQYPAILGKGQEPGKRYRRLLGWLRLQQELAWRVESENAVYQITTLSPTAHPLPPDEVLVRAASEPVRDFLQPPPAHEPAREVAA